jgi:Amt family ammonium transporter
VLEPWAALLAGAVGALIFDAACWAWLKMRIDDPLGAAPMHGVCGAWGVLVTGLLAAPAYVKEAYPNSAHFGALYPRSSGRLLAAQLVGIAAIAAWVCFWTGLLFYCLRLARQLRISPEEEQAGLDVSKHGGSAYNHDHGLNGVTPGF